jgi:hypothetical protein
MLTRQLAAAQFLIVKIPICARCATSFNHDAIIVGNHFICSFHFHIYYYLNFVSKEQPILTNRLVGVATLCHG